ncbi:hypothetical protein SAR116_0743 [Candidatus Puniceispirillum marinum IMCC1322]|uniref:Uncharacterized protein n=1 Tax=Puniceispirillum marinum (strain IMCC1322) TaxID=488538 RepID=D5BRT9_PUNMI|nr:hypothetical protein SAR116_0743 [Candidatus Puniceispirillum marinum IMCC1322]
MDFNSKHFHAPSCRYFERVNILPKLAFRHTNAHILVMELTRGF